MGKNQVRFIPIKHCFKATERMHGAYFRDFVQIMLCHAWSIGILEAELWGDIPNIAKAAVLHDVGKNALPQRIVNKKDRLTTKEYEEMQQHTILGAAFLDLFVPEVKDSDIYDYAEHEENEACREMIEDNIQEIGLGIASNAMRHRFFLVFQYEAGMRAKRNTVQAIVQRLNEEADTARRYLDVCELEVLEPRYCDNFILKLLYEILSKKTSQRVRLPDGVFDMTTAVHGIYEE